MLRRFFRPAVATSLSLLAVLAVSRSSHAAEPRTETVTYKSGEESVSGFLAAPDGAGKKPALVVIHEWWGLNDFARGKARHFAANGYVTLAIDLYRGKSATDADTAHQLMRGLPEDRATRDLKAAVAYLAQRPDVDKARIGSVGWCMGGGYSLALAAAEPSLAAAVVYYGRLITDAPQIAGIKAKLLGSFGGDDKGIPPEDVKAFEASAKKAGLSVDFKVYPGAGHAFASAKDPKVFREADARDADARTDAFLAKALAAR
jgi:carboxymethylenebutenolidase